MSKGYHRNDPRYRKEKQKEQRKWDQEFKDRERYFNNNTTRVKTKDEAKVAEAVETFISLSWKEIFCCCCCCFSKKKPQSPDSGIFSIKSNNKDPILESPSKLKQINNTYLGKAIPLSANGQNCGTMYEQKIKVNLNFKYNNQIITITEYRSVALPDKVELNQNLKVQLACHKPDGSKMPKEGAPYLIIEYNNKGQVSKMSLPHPPKLLLNPDFPILTVHKDQLCTLPISMGGYNFLKQKIEANGGEVVVTGYAESYSLDLLG